MSAISVRIRAIVDPCGRVLVHEVEKLLPLEDCAGGELPPANWYRSEACRCYEFELQLPLPHVATPLITYMTPPPGPPEELAARWRRETPKPISREELPK